MQKIINFFKNIGLIYVLVFTVLIGILLPTIIAGYIIVKSEKDIKMAELREFGLNTSKTLAIVLRGHLWDIRQDLASELINTLSVNKEVEFIEVIDSATNTVFVKFNKKTPVGGNLIIFLKPIVNNGQKIGELRLAITDFYTQETIASIEKKFLLIFSSQLIVSIALIILLLYIKILKPLNKLNFQAGLLAKNELDVAFEWTNKDEIGMVGKNFEIAREELYQAQQFSKNYEQKLKEEVEYKTAELRDLNENLEQIIIIEIAKNRKQDLMIQQQSRLAALGEMIGNIAHQWRQPLSAITSYASGLQLKNQLGIADKEDIETTTDGIVKSAKFLSQTIDDFRNFLKNDKTKKIFNVSQVILDVYNIVKATFNAREIKTKFDLDTTIEYEGYPNELSQVILNILNNAKDALVQNNIENKHVTVSAYSDDSYVFITVTDNAGGIAEDILDKIFDPYFTTKHQNQGTGIGLYMSSQIVKDNFGGRLYANNIHQTIDEHEYFGAVFHIELPIITSISNNIKGSLP